MRTNLLFCGRRLLMVAILSSLLCGCKEVNTTRHPSLNESEIFFDGELLASISPDVFNESLFFIGTEDGVVYEYHSDYRKIVRRFESGADRIYKVVRSEEDGDTIYWLGTRNQGLWRCQIHSDSLVRMDVHGRYFIPTTNKATEYSAYDISVQPNGVYVGTSHGLLKVPADSATSDILEIIAPASFKPHPEELSPVVAGNILIFDSNTMFCASDSGLWKVDMQKAVQDTTLFPKQKIWNITERDGKIYALTEQQIKIVDKQGSTTDSIVLGTPSQVYYYEEYEKVNYFLNDNQIQIVQDDNLRFPKKYNTVGLRRPVRTHFHNVIVNDPRHRQSLMITDHALIRMGHHQDVLNPINAVAHATTDEGFIYYQIDHRLFRQVAGDTIAHHIKNFPKDMSVRFMEVLNGKLYYVDADNRIFQSRNSLYSNFLFNTLFSIFGDREVGSLDKRREVTAIGKNDTGVYVGVRDGFRCVVSNPDKDIQLLSVSWDTIPNPFVTAFAQTNGRDAIFGTLNDGIFVGRDTTFLRKPDSNTIKFIRDIALKPNGAGYYVLNNRNLYSLSTEGELIDCKPATGFRKLLIPDTCHIYGISSYGLLNFKDSTEYFTDIIFNPQASVVYDGVVYASSSSGVYMLFPSFDKKGNVETGYKEIKFQGIEYLWVESLSLAALLLICFLSFLLVYGKKVIKTLKSLIQKQSNRIETLSQDVQEQNNRMETLLQEKQELSEEIQGHSKEIEKLSHEKQELLEGKNTLSIEIQTLKQEIHGLSKEKQNLSDNYQRTLKEIVQSGIKRLTRVSFYLVDNQREVINQLEKETEHIFNKKTWDELPNVNDRIQDLLISIVPALKSNLSTQISRLNKLEKSNELDTLIKQSDGLKESKDVGLIVEQLERNSNFESYYKKLELFSAMFDYTKASPYAIKLDGINFKEIIISESMTVAEKVEEIYRIIHQLNKERVTEYLTDKKDNAINVEKSCKSDMYSCIVKAYLDLLEKIPSAIDYYDILRDTYYINQQLFMRNKIKEIQDACSPYEELKMKGKQSNKQLDESNKRIRTAIDDFCNCLYRSQDWELLKEIEFFQGNDLKSLKKYMWIPFYLARPETDAILGKEKAGIIDANNSTMNTQKKLMINDIYQNKAMLEQKSAFILCSIVPRFLESIKG